MLTFHRIMTMLCAGALILSGSCKKQPEAPKVTVIPSASQTIFSSGMDFEYSGMTQTVSFTAPDSWVAAAEDTKASGWVSLLPASGVAGDVTMRVIVQANYSHDARSARVTIKSAGESASFTVRQTGKPVSVESVKLDKDKLELTEGDSATLTATVNPENAADKTVIWSSSDSSIATVDASGKVTAVKEGSATITAKAGGKSATCAVTVNPKVIAVDSVTLSKTELTLKVGETATLTATVNPSNATHKTVTWYSSDTEVATVDANGKVTAVQPGLTSIYADADGVTGLCEVTVSPPDGGWEGMEEENW